MQNKMLEIMDAMDIAFPNLGIYLENVPQTFTIFGIEIYLYGVMIALGGILGIFMAEYAAKVNGMKSDDIWDFALIAIICSVIGARLYYVIFKWDSYVVTDAQNFLMNIWETLKNVVAVWEGGLAIYGGIIAAVITLYVFAKKKGMSFFSMADSAVLGLVTGQIIGRWGNFVNGEAYGNLTPDSAIAILKDIRKKEAEA